MEKEMLTNRTKLRWRVMQSKFFCFAFSLKSSLVFILPYSGSSNIVNRNETYENEETYCLRMDYFSKLQTEFECKNEITQAFVLHVHLNCSINHHITASKMGKTSNTTKYHSLTHLLRLLPNHWWDSVGLTILTPIKDVFTKLYWHSLL